MWTIIRLRSEMLVESMLATPLDVFRSAAPAEQQRALALTREISPVSLEVDGLKNDAPVTAVATGYDPDRITASTLAIRAKDDLYGTYGGAS